MNKNEVLQNAAADAINKLSAFLSESKDFVVTQSPELASQILAYNLAVNIILIIVAPLAVYISYMATFKWSDQTEDYLGSWNGTKVFCGIVGFCISFVSIFLAFSAIFSTIKIVVSPKLYLLEYVLQFTKG